MSHEGCYGITVNYRFKWEGSARKHICSQAVVYSNLPGSFNSIGGARSIHCCQLWNKVRFAGNKTTLHHITIVLQVYVRTLSQFLKIASGHTENVVGVRLVWLERKIQTWISSSLLKTPQALIRVYLEVIGFSQVFVLLRLFRLNHSFHT